MPRGMPSPKVLLAPSSLFNLLLDVLFLEGIRCHGAPQQTPRPVFQVENLGLSLRWVPKHYKAS